MHLRAASSLCSQPRLLVAKSVCVSLSPIPTAPPSPSASHRLLQPSFSSNNHSSRLMSATGHTTITTAANADNQQPSTATPSDQQPQQTPLVQYVVLRRDLWSALKWPLGSIVAQACHAATAALHAGVVSGDAATATYCSEANIDSMHKVSVCVREDKREADAQTSDRSKSVGICAMFIYSHSNCFFFTRSTL